MKRSIWIMAILLIVATVPVMQARASEDLWDLLEAGAKLYQGLQELDKKSSSSSTSTPRSFCKSINWPNTEGECGIAAFRIKSTNVSLYEAFESNNWYTPRAKGYINRVLKNGNFEFYINYLYPKGEDINGYRVGGTVSIDFLYPCVSEDEIKRIYEECVPH